MSDFVVNNKKIAKNTIVLYLRMAFVMLVSFFTTRITLEVLGSEDYGLNNLVGGVVAMFSFINGSMGTAVQRFYSIAIGEGNFDRLKKIFGCGLYLHLVVAIITLLLAEIFAFFFLHRLNIPAERMQAAHIVFQLAMASMCFNIINVPYTALLRAREEFSIIAFADIISALLRLLILYLLVTIKYDKLILFALLNFMISLWSVGYLTYKARKYEETHTSICRDKNLIKEMISFVSLLLFTVLAQVIRDNGLTVLVNLYFGLALNAAFAIAIQVSHMVTTFVMNFKQAIVPQLMTAWGADNKKAMLSLINIGTKVTFLLMLILTVPIIFESNFILHIWLKEPPQHAEMLVSLAVLSINISSFTYFLYQAVHATGKIKYQQLWMALLYVLNVIFIFVAFEHGGNHYFAYYITIVISSIQCVVNMYFAKKHIDLSLSDFCMNIILRSLLLFSIVVGSYYLLTICVYAGWIRLILGLITNTIICIIGGYIVLLNKEEKHIFRIKLIELTNIILLKKQ